MIFALVLFGLLLRETEFAQFLSEFIFRIAFLKFELLGYIKLILLIFCSTVIGKNVKMVTPI